MHPTPALAAPDHRLARAFLALGDDPAAAPPERRIARGAATLAAAVALALAAPLTWLVSAPVVNAGDQPAAMLGSSKAVLADDDEDRDGGR